MAGDMQAPGEIKFRHLKYDRTVDTNSNNIEEPKTFIKVMYSIGMAVLASLAVAVLVQLHNTVADQSFIMHLLNDRESKNGQYSLLNYPYHLCNKIVYCCLSINPHNMNVRMKKGQLRQLLRLRQLNPHLKLEVGIGGGAQFGDRNVIRHIIDDQRLQVELMTNLGKWLKKTLLDGICIAWMYPPSNEKRRFITFISSFKKYLWVTGEFSLSVVVPFDSVLRNNFFDMQSLSRLLNDYSLYVEPFNSAAFTTEKTHVQYDAQAATQFSQLFAETYYQTEGIMHDARYTLCYLLPLHGLSFTLNVSFANYVGAAAKAPGLSGSSTLTPGSLALDEICDHKWLSTEQVSFADVAVERDEWVSYFRPTSLANLLRTICPLVGDCPCLGVWDPSWDDISGTCGLGKFPLTLTIFQKIIGYRRNT